MVDTYVGRPVTWSLRFGLMPGRPSLKAYAEANTIDAKLITEATAND